MEKNKLSAVLKLLEKERGFDFSGYRPSMLERRINKRIYSTNSTNFEDYFDYLTNHEDELDNLIDVFTINVSRFFRNSLAFEYINKIVFPDLFSAKIQANDNNIRIWSAACSYGEEAYSMAILINEFFRKEESSLNLSILATDIDKKALNRASAGYYDFESIRKVKYGILKRYFTEEANRFKINQEIKSMVHFSHYDMLDKSNIVPPASIFGGFDIVLCRNLLIYFNQDYQEIIFNKLYKSMNKNGYLILGEAEAPIETIKHKFRKENKYCKVYRKI